MVKIVYRGKVLDAIRTALDRGELHLPAPQSVTQLHSLLNKLGRKKWNVRIQERYDHGQGVAIYLAR